MLSTSAPPPRKQNDHTNLPPRAVLHAFGLDGEIKPLPGGEGRSFRVGDIVFKPVEDPIEAEWSSQIMAHLASEPLTNICVPAPLLASNDQCTFQGWTASELIPGTADPKGRWKELLATSGAFHEALRDVPLPEFMSRRSHPWAIADRVAWGEASVDIPPSLQKVYDELVDLRQEVSATSQVIHGDLTGNVLFAEGSTPGVIDFSPYWRPEEFSDAIIIADGLLDYSEGRSLIVLGGTNPTRLQILVRALIFRLVALSELSGARGTASKAYVECFARALELVRYELSRAATSGMKENEKSFP